MSDTTSANSDNRSLNDRCTTCLCSFGIQVERIPRKCINVKCARQYCAQCVNQIQTHNGNDRSFQCMYCLQEYSDGSLPEENQVFIKQLWVELIIKYDIKRTQDLLLKPCTSKDLILDIDCKRRHLMNLVSLYKRFCDRTQLLLTTECMINQLTELVQYIKAKSSDSLEHYKYLYQRLISSVIDDNDIGLLYISLCERFQLEISEAEDYSMFPHIYAKMSEWLHEQGSAEEFQPKLLDLFKTIEQDLIIQRANPYLAARTKIGVIGYVGVGKSSLINRLLGVKSITEEDAVPVSMNKGTYFPLQIDRKEPLASSNDLKNATFVTLVDIQGMDKEKSSMNDEINTDAYLDDICKADCDIYLLVCDDELRTEQYEWIEYIEKILKRQCMLVRSKVDQYYLIKYQELFGKPFNSKSNQLELTIIEQLRNENSIESRTVFLVSCNYFPNEDTSLLNDELFDFPLLLKELSRLSIDTCSSRIHALATRITAHAINTSFRRGYVLNVLRYKVAAGFASIIPFGDQLPRYLSRDSIRDAFGIDDTLRQYLTQFHLVIYNYKLQTSRFADCVEVRISQNNSKFDAKWIGRTAGTALLVGGRYAEDILRVAAPAATAASGAARAVFTVATLGIGAVISAGVSAWSAVDSGKHIFSYINRICNDIIMISDPLISSIIERESHK